MHDLDFALSWQPSVSKTMCSSTIRSFFDNHRVAISFFLVVFAFRIKQNKWISRVEYLVVGEDDKMFFSSTFRSRTDDVEAVVHARQLEYMRTNSKTNRYKTEKFYNGLFDFTRCRWSEEVAVATWELTEDDMVSMRDRVLVEQTTIYMLCRLGLELNVKRTRTYLNN